MEEVLVGRGWVARRTSGCEALASQAVIMTFLAAILLGIFNETRGALCQTNVILLVEVEVITDTAFCALVRSVHTLETS